MNTPKVLKKARVSSRRIFWHIHRVSSKRGLFELRANAIGAELGYSRKTVYQTISYLQRVNLLKLKTPRTGRGKHSVYFVNWGKKVFKSVTSPTPPNKYKDLNALPCERERRYAMMHFRNFLTQETLLIGSETRRCMQVLANHLKGKDKTYKTHLWNTLYSLRFQLEAPRRSWQNPNQIYSWFGWILKKAHNEYELQGVEVLAQDG